MGDSLSNQDCDWRPPRLAEEKLRPMPIAIEREPRPRRPEVSHSPQHCQAAQLVEPITGIKEGSSAWLCILSEELKGSQCPMSTATPSSPSLFLSSSTSITSAASRTSTAFSYVLTVSIVKLLNPTTTSPPLFLSLIRSFGLLLLT